MRMQLSKAAQTALDILTQAGYEAYLVGGCVRDALMDIAPHDFDITTNARPEEVKRLFAGCRLVLDGEKHGTVTPVIDGETIEITTYRADGDYTDGRHPDSVSFSDRLEDDLSRRDFTINAMAWSPARGLVDLFQGAEDLASHMIRAVGDPARRFEEDGLRILRGMRFSSRLGFAVDGETAAAMHDLAQNLTRISRERIFTELTGVLQGSDAMRVLEAFHDVLFVVIPELFPMYMCPQKSVYHIYDVWEHTLHALDLIAPRTPLNVWCALLHDCGKPETRVRDRKGFDHYPQHQAAGAKLAGRILLSLKASNAFQKDACILVQYHDDRLAADTAQYLISRVGPERFESLVSLRRADIMAHAPKVFKEADALTGALERYHEILDRDECVSLKQLAVRGDDLVALGFRNAAIGDELERLLLAVVRGEAPNDRETLLELASQYRTEAEQTP